MTRYAYVKRYVKGVMLRRYCSALAKYEYWTKDEHETWQLARLKRLLSQAERYVPYYRRRFREIGFSAGDFRDIQDLTKLPFTSKSDIQCHGPGAFCDERVPGFLRVQGNTGGSSGIPSPVLYFRPSTWLKERAFMTLQWRRVGYEIGDRTGVLRGRAIPKQGGLYEFDRAGNRLILSTYSLSKESVPDYVKLIDDFKVRFLHVYPASLALFLEYLRTLYGQIRFPNLKGVLAGSEMLLPKQKELCERVLGVPCYHWYGHSEVTLMGGWCEKNDKFHFYPQYGYLETVSDESTNTDGDEIGELVGTGFCNPAMILIRYRTGDLGSRLRWERCDCGREFPTLDKIHGRTQDFLVTRDGCNIPVTALLYGLHLPVFEYYGKIQVEQSEPGQITVRLENPERIPHKREIEIAKKAMEGAVDGRMLVSFEEVDAIPLGANGKHQVVIQNLRPEAGEISRINPIATDHW